MKEKAPDKKRLIKLIHSDKLNHTQLRDIIDHICSGRLSLPDKTLKELRRQLEANTTFSNICPACGGDGGPGGRCYMCYGTGLR